MQSVFSLILVTPKGEKSAGAVTIDLAAKVNQHIEGTPTGTQNTRTCIRWRSAR